MEKDNKNMSVYIAELIKNERGTVLTSGVRHINQENFLQEAYKIIGCRCVDCRSFEYNGTEYDVWFDDEFLLKNGPLYPTLFLGELKPDFFDVICGNFIIAKCNEEGETIGISTDEAKELGSFMQSSIDKLNKAAHMGLLGGVKSAC